MTGKTGHLPAIILAGGRGMRMGGADKAFLTLAGRPLITHLVERLAPQARPLAINASGDPARFAFTGLPVLPDGIPGHAGPLAGILAGLDWAADLGATAILTAAVDTPFLPDDLGSRLRKAAGRSGLAIAASPDASGHLRQHPTFGLWPVALRPDLRAYLGAGDRKVMLWAEAHGAGIAEFPSEPFDPFYNINTAEDLRDAEVIAARGIGA
jgi:molybdenum cofactor guanylyltransferase